MIPKRHRLLFFLGVSLILHGIALYPYGFSRVAPPSPRRAVFALLRMPEAPPLGGAPTGLGGLPEMPLRAGGSPEMPLGAGGLSENPLGVRGLPEILPDAGPVPDVGGVSSTGTVSEALIKDTLQAGKPADPPPAPTTPAPELPKPDPPKKPEAPKRGARNAELPKKPGADRGRPSVAAKRVAPAVVEDAQRRLSERVFYPKEAVERGLEGIVHLIVRFADDGSVAEVDVAVSSGHALLDNAAVRAAYAMGRQIGAASGELVLPVHFQLQD